MAPTNDVSRRPERLEWPVSDKVLDEHVRGLDTVEEHEPWVAGNETVPLPTPDAVSKEPDVDASTFPPDSFPRRTADDPARNVNEWASLRQTAIATEAPVRTTSEVAVEGSGWHVARPTISTIALAAALAVAVGEAAYIASSQWAPAADRENLASSPVAAVVSTPLPATSQAEGSSPSAAERPGTLVVRTDPAGAQVFVDGRLAGTTPATVERVAAGTRQLVIRRNGAEVRQSVLITPGETVSVLAASPTRPARGFGWLAVSSRIELDVLSGDALIGTSRSRRIMLEAGTHDLVLANTELGYRRTAAVRIEAGKVQPFAVTVPESVIHINARPWAEVWLDGKSAGETPIGNLPVAIGAHEVSFRHPQFGERTIRVLVKMGAPTRVSMDLTQPAAR